MKNFVINERPGTRRFRDGSKTANNRPAEQWAIALESHIRVMHNGKESRDCNACKELRTREHEARVQSKGRAPAA